MVAETASSQPGGLTQRAVLQTGRLLPRRLPAFLPCWTSSKHAPCSR